MHVDASTLQVVDAFVKVFQTLFFIIGSICTVLTYRALKRGWLNTVNTEYQKKVIERLSTVANELASEFDANSPNYWANTQSLKELLKDDIESYLDDHVEYKKCKKISGTCIMTEHENRLSSLIQAYETDPFIPKKIRDVIVDFLQVRKQVTGDVYKDTVYSFRKWLKNSSWKCQEELEKSLGGWQNETLKSFGAKGCGVKQNEDTVKAIRLAIQEYFEGFSPVKPPR